MSTVSTGNECVYVHGVSKNLEKTGTFCNLTKAEREFVEYLLKFKIYEVKVKGEGHIVRLPDIHGFMRYIVTDAKFSICQSVAIFYRESAQKLQKIIEGIDRSLLCLSPISIQTMHNINLKIDILETEKMVMLRAMDAMRRDSRMQLLLPFPKTIEEIDTEIEDLKHQRHNLTLPLDPIDY
jgi:hypothetical protein